MVFTQIRHDMEPIKDWHGNPIEIAKSKGGVLAVELDLFDPSVSGSPLDLSCPLRAKATYFFDAQPSDLVLTFRLFGIRIRRRENTLTVSSSSRFHEPISERP